VKRFRIGDQGGSALVNDGRAKAQLTITGSYTADELETLIADLAVARANMNPPVPKTPPSPDQEKRISLWDDPSLSMRLLRDGRIRLWIMNPGIGWLVFNIPVNTACSMRDYLVANTTTVESVPNLSSEDFPNGGTSH
jgi:hypothetical protein